LDNTASARIPADANMLNNGTFKHWFKVFANPDDPNRFFGPFLRGMVKMSDFGVKFDTVS
jgi:hypothetical protein